VPNEAKERMSVKRISDIDRIWATILLFSTFASVGSFESFLDRPTVLSVLYYPSRSNKSVEQRKTLGKKVL
jgi:hypothetical protein